MQNVYVEDIVVFCSIIRIIFPNFKNIDISFILDYTKLLGSVVNQICQSTLYTLHSTLYTLHSAIYTLHLRKNYGRVGGYIFVLDILNINTDMIH